MQDYNQVSLMLTNVGPYLEMWRGPQFQGEHLRVFYLTLQVWLGIASGKVIMSSLLSGVENLG